MILQAGAEIGLSPKQVKEITLRQWKALNKDSKKETSSPDSVYINPEDPDSAVRNLEGLFAK